MSEVQATPTLRLHGVTDTLNAVMSIHSILTTNLIIWIAVTLVFVALGALAIRVEVRRRRDEEARARAWSKQQEWMTRRSFKGKPYAFKPGSGTDMASACGCMGDEPEEPTNL